MCLISSIQAAWTLGLCAMVEETLVLKAVAVSVNQAGRVPTARSPNVPGTATYEANAWMGNASVMKASPERTVAN